MTAFGRCTVNCVSFSSSVTSVSFLKLRFTHVTFSKPTLVSSPSGFLSCLRIFFSTMGSAMSFSGTALVDVGAEACWVGMLFHIIPLPIAFAIIMRPD